MEFGVRVYLVLGVPHGEGIPDLIRQQECQVFGTKRHVDAETGVFFDATPLLLVSLAEKP